MQKTVKFQIRNNITLRNPLDINDRAMFKSDLMCARSGATCWASTSRAKTMSFNKKLTSAPKHS